METAAFKAWVMSSEALDREICASLLKVKLRGRVELAPKESRILKASWNSLNSLTVSGSRVPFSASSFFFFFFLITSVWALAVLSPPTLVRDRRDMVSCFFLTLTPVRAARFPAVSSLTLADSSLS